jgi:hypothetical protein
VRGLTSELNDAITAARGAGVIVIIRDYTVEIIGKRYPHSRLSADCHREPEAL